MNRISVGFLIGMVSTVAGGLTTLVGMNSARQVQQRVMGGYSGFNAAMEDAYSIAIMQHAGIAFLAFGLLMIALSLHAWMIFKTQSEN